MIKLRVVEGSSQHNAGNAMRPLNSKLETRRQGRSVPVLCADPYLAHQYLAALEHACRPQCLPSAQTAAGLRNDFLDSDPPVVLLDESAFELMRDVTLESLVGTLTEVAPLVVVAAPERQEELSFLITSGAVDFVVRNANCVAVAVGLVERRIRFSESAPSLIGCNNDKPAEDFGEILRHEVNNPLTGILGNAELLLALRDRLPPDALARAETIADLAVRLRETVRRLSNAWMVREEQRGSRQ